jgi:hypothetical protein
MYVCNVDKDAMAVWARRKQPVPVLAEIFNFVRTYAARVVTRDCVAIREHGSDGDRSDSLLSEPGRFPSLPNRKINCSIHPHGTYRFLWRRFVSFADFDLFG